MSKRPFPTFCGCAPTAAFQIPISWPSPWSSAAHRSLMLDMPVQGMRAASLATVDLGDVEAGPKSGGPFLQPVTTVQTGASGTPQIYHAGIVVSRELLIGDDAGVIASLAAQLAGTAARIEAKALAALIDLNGALADGSNLITASNTASTTGLSAASLGEASEILLGTTQDNGAVTGIMPRYLVVPPGQLIAGLALVATLVSSGTPPIEVVCLPWLSSGAVYLLGDPQESAVFIRSFPSVYDGEPIIEQTRSVDIDDEGNPVYFDGIAWRFLHAVGVDAVDRKGIAKISMS
jgi:hypothetical protein